MSGSCSIYVFFYAVFYFVTKVSYPLGVTGLCFRFLSLKKSHQWKKALLFGPIFSPLCYFHWTLRFPWLSKYAYSHFWIKSLSFDQIKWTLFYRFIDFVKRVFFPAWHQRIGSWFDVLWIHLPNGSVILAANWHSWILCNLHLHQAHLCSSENWLTSTHFLWWWDLKVTTGKLSKPSISSYGLTKYLTYTTGTSGDDVNEPILSL